MAEVATWVKFVGLSGNTNRPREERTLTVRQISRMIVESASSSMPSARLAHLAPARSLRHAQCAWGRQLPGRGWMPRLKARPLQLSVLLKFVLCSCCKAGGKSAGLG